MPIDIVNNRQVCWVNSDDPPTEVKRLGIFDYDDHAGYNGTEFVGKELCEYKYLRDGVIYDKVLIWEQISVPHYKQQLFRLTVGAMKALMS